VPAASATRPSFAWTPTAVLALVGSVLVSGAGLGFAFIMEGPEWLTRMIGLAFVSLGICAAGVVLRRGGLTSTAQGVGAAGAAMALLSWGVGANHLAEQNQVLGGFSLLAVAAGLYAAGRGLQMPSWRVAGLVAAPFAWFFGAEMVEPWGPAGLGLLASLAVMTFGVSRWIDRTPAVSKWLLALGLVGLSFALSCALSCPPGSRLTVLLMFMAAACLALGWDKLAVWAIPAGVLTALAAFAVADWGPEPENYHSLAVASMRPLVVAAFAAWMVVALPKRRPAATFAVGAVLTTAALGAPLLVLQVSTAWRIPNLVAVPGRVGVFSGVDYLAAFVPMAALAMLVVVRQPPGWRRFALWGTPFAGAAAAGCVLSTPALVLPARYVGLTALAVALTGLAVFGKRVSPRRPNFGAAALWAGSTSALGVLILIIWLGAEARGATLTSGLVVPAVILAQAWALPKFSHTALAAVAYPYFLGTAGLAVLWHIPQWNPLAAVAVLAGLILIPMVLLKWPPIGWLWPVAGWSALAMGAASLLLLVHRSWGGGLAALTLTAASLAVMLTRRPLALAIRQVGAALLTPAASLAVVTFLALTTGGSGSRWLFPVAAGVAAIGAWAGCWLRASQTSERIVTGTTLLIAAAGLGLVTLALAVVWPFSGPTTVFATAMVLAAGSVGPAFHPGGTKQAWWYTFFASCAAFWAVLVWGEVGTIEAYTLPPALVAATIGGLLAAKWPPFRITVASGAFLAVAPPALLMVAGVDSLIRGLELMALAAVALVLAALFDHLRPILAAAGAVAAVGPFYLGCVVALRPFRSGYEALWALKGHPSAQFAVATALGAVAAAALIAAAVLLGRGVPAEIRRWWLLPGCAAGVVVPILGVRSTWPVIGAMWLLMALYLALTLILARLEANGRLVGPPAWTIWLLAVAVGIAAWSVRELRVEAFSVPLGLTLFAAGLITAGKVKDYGRPAAAVAPGVAATLGPSTLAVGTDPLTIRAIAVLLAALVFMAFAARKHWMPPLVTAGASMVVVFIEVIWHRREVWSLAWLLALLVVGGSLLGLALWFERRGRSPKPQA
jgi:hypothetical protein